MLTYLGNCMLDYLKKHWIEVSLCLLGLYFFNKYKDSLERIRDLKLKDEIETLTSDLNKLKEEREALRARILDFDKELENNKLIDKNIKDSLENKKTEELRGELIRRTIKLKNIRGLK